jgi:ribosomal protein S18 acetylase RimI-like enzyme
VTGRVRRAELDDAGSMGLVHTSAWQAAYRGLMPDEYLDSLDAAVAAERWRESLARLEDGLDPAAEVAVLVVEDDEGLVVGISSAGPARDGSGDGEVWMINLLPAAWGQGYGRNLLEEATAELRRAGYGQAVLWVLGSNVRARRVYEAAGWRADGTEKTDGSRGFELHEVRYSRPL